LLNLPVSPYEGNSTVESVSYLRSVALANELILQVEDGIILIKAKDFARHTTLFQGKLTEAFKITSEKMGWDLFTLGGCTVVEYPIAHREIIQTLKDIPRDPFSFAINVTVIDETHESFKGFKLAELVNFTSSNFDLLRYKKPILNVQLPGVSLGMEAIQNLQNNTINLSLTCLAGEQVIQRIDKQTSIITSSRDNFGAVTSQSVTNFVSGFILKLEAFPQNDSAITYIDLEMSTDNNPDTNELPVISRKQIINTGILKIDQVWQCAEFQNKVRSNKRGASFFLPWSDKQSVEQTLLVTIKRIV